MNQEILTKNELDFTRNLNSTLKKVKSLFYNT